MQATRAKTFWDIEKQRTGRIYFLFGFLVSLYFISVFIVFAIVKVVIHLRRSLTTPAMEFHLFGLDTLVVLLIALVAAILHWYYSNRNVVPKVLHLLNAQPPDKHDQYHEKYNNVVDEISTAAGGIAVERYIIPTGAMNAFALADLQGRKVVGITEGLLSRATRSELQAVMAHEIAHIMSNDSLETTVTCSLFGVYSELFAQFTKMAGSHRSSTSPLFEKGSSKDEITLGVLAVPVFILLFVFDLGSQLLNMFISREKEYRADAAAIRLTRNPLSLASALYRIGTHWRGAGTVGERIRPIFILNPYYSQLDEKEGMIATMFSTHPPLVQRIKIILNMAHADLNVIATQLEQKRTNKTAAEATKMGIRFLAKHDNQWHGPYTLMQLQTLEWIVPETHLKIAGQEKIFEAREVPALSYFFQKRNEPIWKIRRICPVCREWLVPQEYEGLYLWRCAYCNGILAEQGKLPRIFVREDKGFTPGVQRIATLIRKETMVKNPRFSLLLDSIHKRRCPKCGKTMVRKFYSYAYHVEIDECSDCKVIWFDADELETLQCLIEMDND
jgi:heat shock protein HtpX